MNTRRLTLAAIVGVGLSLGLRAGAQTIIQTFTFPATPTPFTDPFTFNKFDTTLGVLGSITISVSTNITAEVDIFNNTGANQNFTNATASIPLTVTAPGPVVVPTVATASIASGTVVPLENQFPGLPASATNALNVPMADFGLYSGIGPGTGTLSAASGAGTFSGTSVPKVFFGGSAVASGTITLTYSYQVAGSIPEPGATTFLAAGVLGSLGMVIRRRRKLK